MPAAGSFNWCDMENRSILIIEPSRDLAAVLAKALKRKGFAPAIAHSAQEAIETADKTNPQLVIMELIIPMHNGLEFIHEFRSYAEWLDIPIIIYSQLAPSELGISEKMLGEMGITKHFYKPTTSLSELAEAVESAFASINI